MLPLQSRDTFTSSHVFCIHSATSQQAFSYTLIICWTPPPPPPLLLCSKTKSYPPPLWSLHSFRHPAFSLQTFMIQSAAKESGSSGESLQQSVHDFNTMSSMRRGTVCMIASAVWYFWSCKAKCSTDGTASMCTLEKVHSFASSMWLKERSKY